MPFVDYGDTVPNIGTRGAVDLNPDMKPVEPAADPGLLATMGAALRMESDVASVYADETNGMDRYVREDGFNPIGEVMGTKYESRLDDAADIFNRPFFEAWKRQVDREEEDRATLDAAGWTSLPAMAVAGLVSPTTFIPGGALVRGARGGFSALRSAASVGVAAGAATAASEVALQASQETRTASDTAWNIGGSVVFGGLLGGGAAALMPVLARRNAVAAIDARRQATAAGEPLTPVADEVERYAAGQMASMGAAATTRADIGDLSVYGTATSAYAESIARLNPLLRALHSPSAVSRNIMLGMMENPVYLKMNAEGQTLGASVETVQKQWDRGVYGPALVEHKRLWTQARAAGSSMTYAEFDAAVGRAARRLDQDDNEFVARSAANWRAVLTDPLTREGQEVKLLDEKLGNEFGESYLHRVYNQRKVIAQEPQFREAVRPHIFAAVDRAMQADARKFAKQAENLASEIEELEIGILRRSSEFEQREAGGEIDLADGATEADVLSMIRQLQSDRAIVRPQTLMGWLQGKGLYDPGRNLAAMGINNRTRPGFVRNVRASSWDPKRGGGLSLDDAAQAAWDEGFFPGWVERPTVRELLDAIEDDFRGVRKVVREADMEAASVAQRVVDVEAALSRMGVDVRSPRFATSEDMRGFAAKVNAALDGLDRQRIAGLKAKLGRVTGDRDQMADAFVSPEDKADYVESILTDVVRKITGADLADTPDGMVAKVQGPLKERTLRVPDRVLEPWLEDSMELVQKRFARKMAADVGLTRRYGSADLADQELEIKASYEDLRASAPDEKRRLELDAAMKRDLRDLAFVRDALRGNYDPKGNSTDFARILSAAQTFNYVTQLGGVTVGSLTDVVRPAMVHGYAAFLKDAVVPLIRNMKAVKMSAADAKLAGVIAERALQARMATYAEVIDPYSRSSPFERVIENIAGKFTTLSGLNHFTDLMETVSSVMTQTRILRNIEEGLGGAGAKPKTVQRERAYMAYLGLDEDMARRVGEQFRQHGETLEGVRVAHVDAWSDAVARRTYLAAVAKDVGSTIVQKGVGDLPVWTNTPLGRAAIQYKGFALASNQRVLMRGMQEGPGRFLGGLAGMMTMGMLVYWLKSLEAGRDLSDNVGTWIAEGLDRSGIFSIAFEINNAMEKTGDFGLYSWASAAGRLYDPEADSRLPASRYATRNAFGSLFGPTAGLGQDIATLTGVVQKARSDIFGLTDDASDLAASDIQAMRRLAPYASLPYWRWFIDGGFKGLGWQEAIGFDGVVPELKKAVE